MRWTWGFSVLATIDKNGRPFFCRNLLLPVTFLLLVVSMCYNRQAKHISYLWQNEKGGDVKASKDTQASRLASIRASLWIYTRDEKKQKTRRNAETEELKEPMHFESNTPNIYEWGSLMLIVSMEMDLPWNLKREISGLGPVIKRGQRIWEPGVDWTL